MPIKSLVASVLTLMSLAMINNAMADWTPEFKPPTNSRSIIQIDLPADLDTATLTTLAVELDGIDITSLISFQNGSFLYTPVQALTNGDHLLRLIVLNGDGNSNEKAKWTFNIANAQAAGDSVGLDQQQINNTEAWLRSASFAADTLTEFSHRFKQQNIGSAPGRSIISGSGNVVSKLQGENWTIDAQTNYLLQTDQNLRLTDNTADIGEYKIAANYNGEKFNTGFTLGHHDTGLDSLLISNFYRRGASVHIEDNSKRVAAKVFAFRPEAQVGKRDFTGLSESHNRLEGVTATVKPFSSDIDALTVTGMYYDGEGATGGIGITGQPELSSGSGWAVQAAKNFAKGRINLRGEYAHSNYDLDGNNNLASEDSSDAYSFLIEVRPFDNPVLLEKTADIVFGAKYERIDTFFDSLANEGLAADREAIIGYTNLNWGALSNNLQVLHETNNVDDLASMPTDRLRSVSWNSNYAFDPQTGDRAWLGTPFINVSGFVSELDRKNTPTAYLGVDTDNKTTSVTATFGSNYEDWYWSASHNYSRFDDRTNSSNDTVNNFSSIDTGWIISDRLLIVSNLQYGIFKDRDNDATSNTTNMNFAVQSNLIPNKLDLNLNYNLNLAGGVNDTPDKHIINGELGWTFRQAQTNQPGLAFAIRGSMETSNGNTNTLSNETNYQIFAVLRITAPLSAGF